MSGTAQEVAVLVVDDVEDNRVALKAFLEAEGIRAVRVAVLSAAVDLVLLLVEAVHQVTGAATGDGPG